MIYKSLIVNKEVNEKDERIERYRKRINKLDKECNESPKGKL